MNSESAESHCVPAPAPAPPADGGQLIPLKTILEIRAAVRVLNVYITTVPIQKASSTLGLVRTLVPRDGGYDFQHLRRFAKPGVVPEGVRRRYFEGCGEDGPESLRSSVDENEGLKEEGCEEETKIFLLIAATSIISPSSLLPSLESILGPGVKLSTTEIPLLAPTSAEQAKGWSEKYWPCVYKKSIPFGPHVAIVSRAQEEVLRGVRGWMDSAWGLADAAREEGVGEGVGVVIVERRGGEARVVVGAGDGRWCRWGREEGGEGNVTAHAVMRGIGMVSEGLARDYTSPSAIPPFPDTEGGIFRNHPLLDLENDLPEKEVDVGGYLCHDLEIYCTHEPCVMCSMAIVHSRFGRAVFEKRMCGTGGLCADEGGLGHGLWWRKELNWTMLGWRWVRPLGFREGRVDVVDVELDA
ncbi:hypothetical protein HYALB_00005722 [Hymenoscyphus albidus]|uniref:CMP/dCMP-type deaminase domain-containing protein n=1 Tax=Hymenoscyphus albidus TaxID=595503 RepID=A0A9N9LPL1_9HELO|nr:hypothetical protein HYALB_00005722 [Hymenoscyphus albidus]